MRILPALVATLLVGCSSQSPSKPAPAGSTVVKVQSGGSPCGVVEAAGAVWVTDAADGRLLRIDPRTHQLTVAGHVDQTPCELTFAFGALWVTTQSGVLDRVDPATGKVTAKVAIGLKSYETEATDDALWVSDRSSDQLTRVDPRTLRATTLATPGVHPGGLVWAFGALWVGDDTSGATALLRVDPATRKVTKVPAGHRPAYVTATATAVWVSESEDGTVSRIDPTSLARTTVTTGGSPVNLDVVGGDVWVPDDVGNAVVRIDGGTAKVRERIAAPDLGPAVVAPVGTTVWATMFTGGQVWAITPAD